MDCKPPNDETGTAREMLADFPSSHNRKIVTTMEEKILQELEELKRLTLLQAKTTLTLDDVVLLYGLSASTIYKKTSAREIPHYRKGKLLFFDKAELDQWAKANRINTQAEAAEQAEAYCLSKGKV